MFSLIVAILAVVLVALLTAATLYYVGNTVAQGQVKAQAATYINQGQQLLAATQAFYAHEMRLPDNIGELVTQGYLRSVPEVVARNDAPRFELIASAYAQTAPQWSQASARTAIYWVRQSVGTEVCRAVNLQTRGDDGIYEKARPQYSTQCYGTAAPFTVLVAQGDLGPSIVDALPPGEAEPAGTVPPWAVPPGVTPASTPPTGAPPVVTLSADPALVDFGPMLVGQTSTVTVTVTNSGAAPVNVTGVTAPAALSHTTTCSGALAPSASCTVELTYTATVPEPASGSATVTTATGALALPWVAGVDTDCGNPESGGSCNLSLQLWAWASGYVGGTYGPYEGTLSNYTGSPQTLTELRVYGSDFATTPYTDVDGYGYPPCTVGMTLNDGEVCGVAVNFTPQQQGNRSAYLWARTAQGERASTRLEGFAEPAAVKLFIRDSNDNLLDAEQESANGAVWFPMAYGNNPATATLRISNEGSLPANNFSIDLPAPFAVQASTCGSTIAAGAQCNVTVSYAPGWYDGIRVRTASVDWAGRTLATPLRVRLFGRSVTAAAIDTQAPPAYAVVLVPTTDGRPLTSVDSTVFSLSNVTSSAYSFTANPASAFTDTTVWVVQLAGNAGMGAMQLTGGAATQYRFPGASQPRLVTYGEGYWWDEVYRCSPGYMADGYPCGQTVRFTTPSTPGAYTTTLELYGNYGTPMLGHTVTLTATRP